MIFSLFSSSLRDPQSVGKQADPCMRVFTRSMASIRSHSNKHLATTTGSSRHLGHANMKEHEIGIEQEKSFFQNSGYSGDNSDKESFGLLMTWSPKDGIF